MKKAQNHTVSRFKLTASCVGWLLLFLIFIAIPMNADAQTVHALLVVVDADSSLGTSMKANQTKVEQLLETVEAAGELQVEMQALLSSQNEATTTQIKAWLEGIHLGEDDVIFVYFSGYGSTEGAASVFLQDGELRQTELAQQLRDAGICRLKLLIVDACRAKLHLSEQESPRIDAADVTALFRNTEGFIYLTSATPPEFGWVDEQEGGLFTNALMHALAEGLTSWTEVFDAAKQGTAASFRRASATLLEEMKAPLRRKGIESQTPKAYELPKQSSTRNEPPNTRLWHFTNPASRFTVSIETAKTDYQLKELITFDIEVTADVHLLLLNWDTSGDFNLLFPNGFQNDTQIRAGTYTLPAPDGKFDIELTDVSGTEKFKVLAFRNNQDSQTIVAFFPEEEEGFRSARGKQVREVQQKILAYLQDMKATDWAEAHREIALREAKRPKSRFRLRDTPDDTVD